MELTEDSAEKVVCEALCKHYTKFNMETHENTVASIVTLINDSDKRYMDVESGFESDAVYLTRMILLEVFRHGVSSVKATTDIFNSLERGPELGWLAN